MSIPVWKLYKIPNCCCTESNKIQFLEEEPEPAKEEVFPKLEEVDSDAELENELQVEGTDLIDPSRPVSTAELLASREEALRKRRLLIGVLASGLLENPQLKVFLE
jgi:hypothetical protein